MQRILCAATIAACALVSASATAGSTDGPATATAGSDIVVLAPSVEAWSTKVFGDIDRNLRYPTPLLGMPLSEGMVAVKFNCSETGEPAGIELSSSSGHSDLDKATMRAVRRIATLHPLPQGVSRDQRFLVRVLFARSSEELNRRTAEMRAQANAHNARIMSDRGSLAALEILPVGG